jgi:putative PIN family toxin of toxin-antitoxin system
MRVVLDANVAIAAAATRGLCDAVLELCIERHRIVLCRGILAEIEDKLRRKLRIPPAIVAEYVKYLENNAQVVEPATIPSAACRDPEDLMVLGVALSGGADVVVTGDHDLLSLKSFKGVQIVAPRMFWETHQKQE